jgi:signal transduction histidine kinase
VDAGEAPAPIAGNEAALKRLFVVLLDNAVKFSNEGCEVVARIEIEGPRLIASIEDSGAGISAADLPNIFRRFYRADSARAGAGHGLGLALAESIAKMHGAAIEVRSTEGAGSVFRVVFPARAGLRRTETVAM